MGGKGRGSRRKEQKMKVVDENSEQGARNEAVTEEDNGKMEFGDGDPKKMEFGDGDPKKEERDLFERYFFLVRSWNSNVLPITTTARNENLIYRPAQCVEEDFHVIDLTSKSSIPYYLPSIINCIEPGTMFLFEYAQVLIFGADENYYKRIPHHHNVDDGVHIHKGSSCISLLKRWKPFESPHSNSKSRVSRVNPAVLFHKLYSFGYPFLSPMVHYPRSKSSNVWNPLPFPDHLADKEVSFPVLPDPLNSRIIVHFPCLRMLYAFCPTDDEKDDWKPLVPNFKTWHPFVAIFDNIIFFHPSDVYNCSDLVHAYDVNTSKQLVTMWDFSKIGSFVIVYDAIFTLSDKGLMCLASGISGTCVKFLRFRVKRTSDTHLKITAIDYQIHDIPSASHISDIILY